MYFGLQLLNFSVTDSLCAHDHQEYFKLSKVSRLKGHSTNQTDFPTELLQLSSSLWILSVHSSVVHESGNLIAQSIGFAA